MATYPKLPRGASVEIVRQQIEDHPKSEKLYHVLSEYEKGRFLKDIHEIVEFLGYQRVPVFRDSNKQLVTDRNKLAVQVLRAFWRKTDNQIFNMLDNPLRQDYRVFDTPAEV